MKPKHDKDFKVKEAKAKTLETIKTAKLKMEQVKIEEHEKQEDCNARHSNKEAAQWLSRTYPISESNSWTLRER